MHVQLSRRDSDLVLVPVPDGLPIRTTRSGVVIDFADAVRLAKVLCESGHDVEVDAAPWAGYLEGGYRTQSETAALLAGR